MDGGEIWTKRWSRLEDERLIDGSMFKSGERLELIDGLLVVREPQGSPHTTVIEVVTPERGSSGYGIGSVSTVKAPSRCATGSRASSGSSLALPTATPCATIVEFTLGENPLLHELVEEPFDLKDGYVLAPEKPGLGLTLRRDFVRSIAVA